MPARSLRATRDALLAETSLKGDAFCRALSDATDAWLSEVAEEAKGKGKTKVALLAVGGYGRRELCPYSDLDLLLLYDKKGSAKEFADQLWYPVWDQGLSVDHAVRRPKDVVGVAQSDLRVALGLLDARVIWGDEEIALPVLEEVRALWRGELAKHFLPELQSQMQARHNEEGDVAFLLEPNLKESHGGLRDVNVLRSLPECAPVLRQLVDFSQLDAAAATLVAVRVELHRAAQRGLDRLLLQEQDQIAAVLDYGDADELCRAVSEAGRTIARISDETWRRRPLWEPGAVRIDRPLEVAAVSEPGIMLGEGEVALEPGAAVGTDPTLPWRLAAVAAEHDLPIARASLEYLAIEGCAAPSPWSDELRAAFVRLLLAGKPAIAAFEALDQVGLVERDVPEWSHVRHYHQRNAYHRYTVDRHLLEAATNAAALVDTVDRPDLLVVGALFHDIGKGLDGDHTELGIEIIESLAPRMGFSEADTDVLATLVREHLLLADVATRRDLSDPKTIEIVASKVTNISTLMLLAGVTKADGMATGKSAWGPWKQQLVEELVVQTAAFLQAEGTHDVARRALTAEFSGIVEAARTTQSTQVVIDPPRVIVASPDRPGLLADVAGTLALNRLDVLGADAAGDAGIILDVFVVTPLADRWPEADALATQLEQVFARELDLEAGLQAQAQSYAPAQRPWSARPVAPLVSFDDEAATGATVVEVRAPDRVGLLHELTSAIFEEGLDVSVARVATIGGDVVDVFYVNGPEGSRFDDAERRRSLAERLLAIVSPSSRPS